MHWDQFQTLYDNLKKSKLSSNTKIRILYASYMTKQSVIECQFKDFLPTMWKIYDNENIINIVIFAIKDKLAKPIFRNVTPDMNIFSKRPTHFSELVLDWNKTTKGAKKVLMKLAMKKIEEELYEYHS